MSDRRQTMDIEKLARHVRNIAAYEGITEGQGNVLLAASAALESERAARLAAEAELATIMNPLGVLLPDEHDADWWRRTAAFWAGLDFAHADEVDALRAVIKKAREAISAMKVLEAGQSYGVRLAWGEINKVHAVLAAVPGNPETTDTDSRADPKPWFYPTSKTRTAHKLAQTTAQWQPRTQAQYDAEATQADTETER